MERRHSLLANLGLVSVLLTTSASSMADEIKYSFRVYKSPTCGCCNAWVDHMKDSGYEVSTNHPMDLNAVKRHFGVQQNLSSCHTAVSEDNYIFEGHVPAKFVESFLANPPTGAIGLSVPAMPVGTPGMEVGDKFMPYKVMLMFEDGSSQVFASIGSQREQF